MNQWIISLLVALFLTGMSLLASWSLVCLPDILTKKFLKVEKGVADGN